MSFFLKISAQSASRPFKFKTIFRWKLPIFKHFCVAEDGQVFFFSRNKAPFNRTFQFMNKSWLIFSRDCCHSQRTINFPTIRLMFSDKFSMINQHFTSHQFTISLRISIQSPPQLSKASTTQKPRVTWKISFRAQKFHHLFFTLFHSHFFLRKKVIIKRKSNKARSY